MDDVQTLRARLHRLTPDLDDEVEAESIRAILAALPALLTQLEAARLQADEWRRYAEAHDAGLGTTVEEERDALREEVRILRPLAEAARCFDVATNPCDLRAGIYCSMGSGPEAEPVVAEAYKAADLLASTLKAYDAFRTHSAQRSLKPNAPGAI